MNTYLHWNIAVFAVLLFVAMTLCVAWKKSGTPDGWFRYTTLSCILLSYVFPFISILVWSYIGMSALVGSWFAVAGFLVFWIVPWVNGSSLFAFIMSKSIQAAINFSDTRLEGRGFQTFKGNLGNTIFVAIGNKERMAMKDMMSQIIPQVKEQVGSPIKRWLCVHWRWYDPMVGGYCCFNQEMADKIDDCIHNVYGFPITRKINFDDPSPIAGVLITEINSN